MWYSNQPRPNKERSILIVYPIENITICKLDAKETKMGRAKKTPRIESKSPNENSMDSSLTSVQELPVTGLTILPKVSYASLPNASEEYDQDDGSDDKEE